jgi:hypothetical protein
VGENSHVEVACDEIVKLAAGLGMTVPPFGLNEHAARQAGARAAMVFDDKLTQYLATNATLPQSAARAGSIISVSAMVDLLAPVARANPAPRELMPPMPSSAPVASKFPRAEALQSTAESKEVFAAFLVSILPWFVEERMRPAVMADELTMMAALEAWLGKAGERADPSILRAASTQPRSCPMLINVAMQLDDHIRQLSQNTTVPTPAAASAGVSGTLVHQVVHPDTSGSEQDRMERAMLATNAQAVMASAPLCEQLQAIAALAEAGDEQAVFEQTTSATMRVSPLFPIFATGSDIPKAVSGYLSQSMLLQVMAVRGCLVRRIERAFCEGEVKPSQRVRAAIHQVRIGRVAKVKLFNLLDEADSGTADDPLKQLVGSKDGDASYARAIASLMHVWILSTPADVAAVTRFCSRLSSFTATQRALGATWQALSRFHAAVFKKVDEEAEKFSLHESKIARASPRVEWIDSSSKYQQALHADVAAVTATKAAEAVMAKMKTDSASSSKKIEKAIAQKLAAMEERAKEAEQELKRQAKKRKGSGGQDEPAAAPAAGASESNNAKRKRIMAELIAKHGEKDGKPPCYFHFSDGNKCKFSAADCRKGHHGEDE